MAHGQQVGAALENNRLIRESLARERMAREMELAHNLQMKLLPAVESLGDLEMAARVEPAEQVGGDFYQLFRLSEDRIGVMIGDVSTHGFPAALIMALAMSASSIYALEKGRPAGVLPVRAPRAPRCLLRNVGRVGRGDALVALGRAGVTPARESCP